MASLPPDELARRLDGDGIVLRLPPFAMRIRSPIPVVAQGLRALYPDHVLLEGEDHFVDFHVAVKPRRRLFKSVCVFEMDGFQPFTPLAYGEAFAFLEWGMNWCVTSYCHTWITIHSAVLERNGRVVLLPAPPGSGKSTLCAALMLSGWRLLSDEMALLDPVTGLVTPSPRPVSLKNRSIEVIRQRAPDAGFGPVARDTMKGTVAHMRISADSLARADEPARPAWVVFPRYQQDAPLTITERPRASALVELASNSFNQHVHGRDGFQALARLVDGCACHDLAYGQLDEAIAWFNAQAEAA
ncbi:HprK-related kinase A [Hydrogenophaga sp.]|uniref:HprK-related kinase A n=1 Tax=Hydrogenophaga sp. TaxID=1904254 RepID=UPI0026103C55|nr:HprK-related kinase A [Hydrogenophaga sp.]MCW5654652.1 HprK-related kinase A [Hydrogenophaga sp.]